MSTMTGDVYGEGYFEHGVKSNYHGYNDDHGWHPTVNVLRMFAKPESWLYEIGCAKGFFVQEARRQGFNAYGSDISEYAIASAPEPVRPYVQAANAAVKLPAPDNAFSVVCSWETLEHVPEPEIRKVLLEARRIAHPEALHVHRIDIPDGLHDPFSDETHVLIRERIWWEDLFHDMGYGPVNQSVIDALDITFQDRDWHGRFFAFTG